MRNRKIVTGVMVGKWSDKTIVKTEKPIKVDKIHNQVYGMFKHMRK